MAGGKVNFFAELGPGGGGAGPGSVEHGGACVWEDSGGMGGGAGAGHLVYWGPVKGLGTKRIGATFHAGGNAGLHLGGG